MAKRDYIHLGDATNRAQATVVVPAKSEANKPGILNLQSVSGTTVSDRFLWFTSAGVPRYGGTFPTTPDSDGSSLVGGATTTLSNLASVAIPDVGDLLPLNANQVSVGNATKYMSDVFIGGSLYHQTATFDVRLTFATPAADRAYAFPDAGGDGDVMINVGGANAITLTNGTANVTLGAAAALDIGAAGDVDFGTGAVAFNGTAAFDLATGKTVDINANVTIGATAALTTSGASAITLDQDLQASASPTFNALTVTSVTDGTATLTTGALSGITTITTSDAITIDGDSVKLRLGDTPASDSYIMHTAAGDLTFYDPNTGVVKLVDLAGGTLSNPDVTGDFTITDGKIIWTDAVDEVAGTWTFAGVTNDGIDIVANSATSSNVIHVASTSLTSGTLIRADAAEATLNAGYYFEAYDSGSSTVWSVGEDGRTVITGLAGDSLTIDLGDIQMTNGNIDIDEGKIEVNSTADEISYVKRNNATGTGPVFEIEETNATGGTTLLVDSNATDANDALQVTHDGTGYGLSVIGTAATGKQALFQGPASQTASSVFIDGTTGSWIGGVGAGMLHLSSDGALASTTASLIYSNYTGNAAGANQSGSCAIFDDGSTASGASYAVYVASSNNNALNIITGATGKTNINSTGIQGQTVNMVNFSGSTGTGWVGADGTAILKIGVGGGTMAHANASLLNITNTSAPANSALGSSLRIIDTGTAAGAKPAYVAYISSTNQDGVRIDTGLAASSNLVTVGAANQTGDMVLIDGDTAGWLGADGKGMVHIQNDIAHGHANASMLWIDKSAAIAEVNSAMGSCLRISENMNVSAVTPSYAVYVNSTNNEAIKVDAGKVVVNETVTASEGVITAASVANVTNPPLNSECDTAFGAALQVAGGIGFINDANLGTNEYLVVHDGTDWWYLTLTKCAA